MRELVYVPKGPGGDPLDHDDILSSISRLYLSGSSFDLDVTYGRGHFYRNLPAARYKFDIIFLERDG